MMNKILIGVPCMDSVDTKFAFSLFNLKRPENSELIMRVGAYVDKNRNDIVKYAIDGGFTHVLFIDSDMKFNPDILEKLLSDNVDICGVLYHQRKLPLVNVVMPINEPEIKGRYEFVPMVVNEDLTEVTWVGTGVMLVNVEVFKKMNTPYPFQLSYDGEFVGEDVFFCRKARELGYKIYVDADIQVRHIGEFEY